MRYYVPNPCGDFRLLPDGDEKSILTIQNATPGEIVALRRFLATAKERGWADARDLGDTIGFLSIAVNAPVHVAGPVLAGETIQAPSGQFTAVRSESGKISIDVDPTKAVETATAPETTAKEGKPEAAVTAKKPTLCCPVPISGPDIRASEVLKDFCTPEQWRDWERKGWLIAFGQVSGHAYRIAHRHSDAAKAQGKIVWDLDDDAVIHCWDWTVPPAEEVLAIKLLLEGREPWIRNNSGALGAHRDRFKNPLGDDGLDGTDNAAALEAIGQVLGRYPHLYLDWARGDWNPVFGYGGGPSN